MASFSNGSKSKITKKIFGHGWILSNDKKCQNLLGNILDPIEIINKFGIDQLRYYLIKEVSLGNDGSISIENLKNCINNDLANNYGNLCQKSFSFIKKNLNNKIPKSISLNSIDEKLINNIKENVPKLVEYINNQNLNDYIKMVVDFSFEANKYFNDAKPWSVKKNDPERMKTIIFITEQIKNISILLYPIIPITSKKVLDTINISEERNIN